MAKIIQLPTTTYYHRTFLPGHQADVRYFPRPTPIYHGAKYIDSDNITRFSRLTGYALPGGFMSFTDRLSPRIISLAISFWQEHEKRDNEWVPRFQQFPPARQIDYLRIFFSHHNPRNFFEKATETTARRISVLAKHDLALARTIFWRLDEISRSGFDQAVFYALTSQPLLQTQLLVARGVTQGARLLTETFEDRPYDDLEAVHILAQGKGLTLEEKKILQEIGKRFFQHRGGSERALIMHRLVVWQAKVKKAVRFTKYVEHKIMSSKGKNIEETAESKKSLDKIWAQLCNGLGRFSASDLYDLLSLFYKNDRFLVLEKMVENGYIDQVDAFDYYQTFEMGNK